MENSIQSNLKPVGLLERNMLDKLHRFVSYSVHMNTFRY